MRVEAVSRPPLAPVSPGRGSEATTMGRAPRSTSPAPVIADRVELSVDLGRSTSAAADNSAVSETARQEVAQVRPDARLQAMVGIVERFTGHRVSLLDSDGATGGVTSIDLARREPVASGATAGWGIRLDAVRTDADLSRIDIAASAVVPAADGGLAEFDLELSMTRVAVGAEPRTYSPAAVAARSAEGAAGDLHLWAHLDEPITTATDGTLSIDAHLGDGADQLHVVASASMLATRRVALEVDGLDSDGDGWLDGNDLPFDFLSVDLTQVPTPPARGQ
jgi:hypothetical protein